METVKTFLVIRGALSTGLKPGVNETELLAHDRPAM